MCSLPLNGLDLVIHAVLMKVDMKSLAAQDAGLADRLRTRGLACRTHLLGGLARLRRSSSAPPMRAATTQWPKKMPGGAVKLYGLKCAGAEQGIMELLSESLRASMTTS